MTTRHDRPDAPGVAGFGRATTRARTGRLPWAAALLTALLALAAEQGAEYFLKREAHHQQRNAVLAQLGTLRARLEGVINANLLLVRGLTAVIRAHPDIDQAEFSRIGAGLMEGTQALRNIGGAPGLVIAMVHPLEGNAAALGLDYRTHASQRDAALRAMETGELVVTNPVSLVQGGKGIIARVPVFLPPAQPGARKRPWGLVSAVLDVDALYQQAGILAATESLQLVIRGSDVHGTVGKPFFGDPAVLDRVPVTLPVTLPSGVWQLAGLPADGWTAAGARLWPARTAGLLIGALLVLAAFQLARAHQALHRSTASLRDSEARLTEAETIASIGNWRYRPADDRIDWSDELYRVFGLAPQEGPITRAWLLQHIHDGDRRQVDDYLQRLTTRGFDDTLVEMTCRVLREDGGERHLNVRARIEPDAAGRPALLFGTAQDITRQAQLQSALRISQARMTALIANLPGVVYRCRNLPDWPMEYVSPAIREFTGCAPEQLTQGGVSYGDLIHPDDRRAVWERIQSAVAAGRRYALEYRVAGPDGRTRWVWEQGQLVANEAGEARLEGFIADITENKRHAAEIERLHGMLQALVRGSTDAIFVKDLTGHYVLANDALSRLLGTPAAQLLGKTDYDLFPAELADRFLGDDRRLMTAATTETYEEPVVTPHGTFSYLTTKGPLLIDGKVQGIFGMARDITSRKRAEQQLRASEARLREAQNLARIGSWEFEPDTGAWRWSDELFELTGFDRAAGAPSLEDLLAWTDPADHDEVRRLFESCRSTGEAAQFEFHSDPAHGPVRFFVARITGVRDPVGRVRLLTGTIQDISDLRRAQVRVREGEALLESVFATLPDLLFVMDPDGNIRDYRASDPGQLYLPPTEFIGRRMQDVLPEPVAAVFADAAARVQSGGGLTRVEYDLALPGGQRHYEARFTLIEGGEQLIAMVRDITDEHASRQALADSQQRFERALENIPDVVVIYDRELRIEYINAATRALTGRPASHYLGRRDDEIWPPEVCDSYLPALQNARDSGAPQRVAVEIDLPGAGRRSLEIHCIPLLDGQGRVRQLLGITHDLSEQKRTEQEIRRLNAALEQRVQERTAELQAANQEMEAFTYAVSHDLRSPLRVIQGFGHALQEDYGEQMPTGALDFLDEIRIGGERMAELIEGLLELSRGSRGALNREAVALDELATAIITRLRRAEPERAVELRCDGDLLAQGDPRLVNTLLQNLLDNAWKYTRASAPALIRLSSSTSDGEKVYCVADNGVGFDDAFTGRLFQPFQRLHRQDEFPGIGIGLATVARIVRRHGGWITASGEPGKGARFCFTLQPRPETGS